MGSGARGRGTCGRFAVAAGFLDMFAYLVLPLRRKVELRWSGECSWEAVRLLPLFLREKKPMVYICGGLL